MSTPFCRVRVAKVCLKLWNRTLGGPARFSTRWSMCNTLSGEMGPPLGDGNTHGLLPAFSFALTGRLPYPLPMAGYGRRFSFLVVPAPPHQPRFKSHGTKGTENHNLVVAEVRTYS